MVVGMMHRRNFLMSVLGSVAGALAAPFLPKENAEPKIPDSQDIWVSDGWVSYKIDGASWTDWDAIPPTAMCVYQSKTYYLCEGGIFRDYSGKKIC